MVARNRSALHACTLLIAASSLLGCATANSHPDQPPQEAAGAGAESEADPIVCRKEDVPGHRMPKRVCRHQSEIDDDRNHAQAVVRQVQTQPSAPVTAAMQNSQAR
jgi:hypothetical protein